MAFLIGGANSAADTGYNIENSLRFDQASSHFLSTTFGSAGNQKTFTISTWCKLGNLATSDEISIMGAGGTSGGNPRSYFQFAAGDLFLRIADNASGSAWKRIITSSRYRDPSAWYHVVATVDTTQGTEADRMKLTYDLEKEGIKNKINPIIKNSFFTLKLGLGERFDC